MSVFQALILGIVQGFTEFLPVSSSGHLVVVPQLFNWPAPTLGFDILVHLATLVAVVGYFVRDVGRILGSLFFPKSMSRPEVKYWRRIFVWLVIGSIPAGIAGAAFGSFFEDMFSKTLTVGIFFVLTSLLLWGADFALGRVNRQPVQLDKMQGMDALIIGCFQALAVAPGLSRSGSTIAGGIFLGFDRPSAARFSFLLSIPAILGAFVFKLRDISGAFTGATGGAYGLGAVAALVSGFVAIWFVMRYVREHRLRVFAIYTLLLGVFVIALSLA
ncbi:MAG: undecaprenyl-diphosphate phosphatase [Actinobacteria bacterium]|nr:undecaprenyl-diphosphate phosphatase [Actinomycetota bacterium]